MENKKPIQIGLAVFCIECESIVRPAEPDDMMGDLNYCPNCDTETMTTVGLSLVADTEEDLHRAMDLVNENFESVVKLLAGRYPTDSSVDEINDYIRERLDPRNRHKSEDSKDTKIFMDLELFTDDEE